jgi:hypothetical protein
MTATTTLLAQPAASLGLAFLARAASDPQQLSVLVDSLVERLSTDIADAGARLDLSTLLLLTGHANKGLEMQAEAIALQPAYRRIHGTGEGVRVLVFMVAGDLMANTPIDFLLEGSNVELTTFYVDDGLPAFSQTPEHDVAFLAISQSQANDPILQSLAGGFDGWPRPVMNSHPQRIAQLTRDGVAAMFATSACVLAPATRRLGRDRLLAAIAQGPAAWDGPRFPVIARPVDSHAGRSLEKLDDLAALAAYISSVPNEEFYVAAFHDYSGADGLFRKLRIAFIDGTPFISHMAVSPRWMVHYLNADMETNPANRAEEAQMMARFSEDFAVRNKAALDEMVETFQLDYFAIDCAETADGKILLFEADVAMIVHAMDSMDLYPYKMPAMARLFEGFLAALTTRARLALAA